MGEMTRRRALAAVAGAAASVIGPTFRPAAAADWGYSGATGPENWGTLKDEYAWCGRGREQSPIDLRDAVTAGLGPLSVTYRLGAARVDHIGHTLSLVPEDGNWMSVDGVRYNLVQITFHSPSEHAVGGRHYDMEMQMIHQNRATGLLSIIGVFMQRSFVHLPVIDQIWKEAPPAMTGDNQGRELTDRLNPEGLLPTDPGRRGYWRYMGSLTRPPCNESAMWTVLKHPVPISSVQLQAFAKLFPSNARPLQPLGRRFLLQT